MAIGGVVVADRDIVVGDSNGVVVVPAAEGDSVLAAAQALAELESKQLG